MRQSLRVAWYRFVATFRVRWSGYLTIVLLVGLLGGLSLASIAGARRTQSSFSTLLARSNSSQLVGLTGVFNPTIGQQGYSSSYINSLRHLPYVKDVKSVVDLNLLALNANGTADDATEGESMTGSVNGDQFTQDRIIVTNGRRPNPKRINQFATDAATAKMLDWHLGQSGDLHRVLQQRGRRQYESLSPEQALKKFKPVLTVHATLVSTGAVQAARSLAGPGRSG
jgi:hypothetical protein